VTKQSLLASVLALSLSLPAWAEFPKNWYVEGVRDMLAGQVLTTALQADGALTLSAELKAFGPRFEASGILSGVQIKDGSVLVATSQPGRVFQVKAGQAKPEALLSLDKGMVTAMVQDAKGQIYAATAPQAEIYSGQPGQALKPLYKAQEDYIWDMLSTPDGKFYFVTGNGGALYELKGQQAQQLFRSQESNLRTLYHDSKWGLIVGGGSQGIVYKYQGPDKVSALLGTPFDEITAITGDGKGNLYVAANRLQPRQNEAKSAVYHINAQGQSEALFPLDAETAYSLALNPDGTLLIGTGSGGRIYAISSPAAVEKRTLSLVARSDSKQISKLIRGQANQILALGSNPAQIETYGSGFRQVGVYESDILATGISASWGMLHVNAVRPAGTQLVAWSRSGNTEKPDATWSEWSSPYQNPEEVKITSPRGRYLQLKFELQSNNPKLSPQVHSFEVNFLRDNLSPTVQQVYFLQRGIYFTPHTIGQLEGPRSSEISSRTLDKLRRPRSSEEIYQELMAQKTPPEMRMIQQYRPGMLTLAWEADDPNADTLLFDIQYLAYGQKEWKTLATDLTQQVYSFDSTTLMDGKYHFRVSARDDLANPGNGYTVYRDSDLMTLDNTPPVIHNLSAQVVGQQVEVRFAAEDRLSPLAYAEYAVNGQSSELIASSDGIIDSKKENFVIRFAKPAPGSHDIVVKVTDRQGNTVHGKVRLEVK